MSTPAPPARRTWRELAAAARTPRMLGLLALLLLAAIVCARLGAWQIDRAFASAAAEAEREAAVAAQTAPEPLSEFLDPGEGLLGTMLGVRVEATGELVAEGQVVVPGREVSGELGYLVVTPMRLEDGAWLAVVRGWIADPVEATPPPEGLLTVTGFLGNGESYDPQVLPAGQVSSISPVLFAGQWGTPMYAAYLVLDAETLAGLGNPGALVAVPAPSGEGGGIDLRNLAYAIEWFVFGAFALVLWYRLVRDEAQHRAADQAPVPDEAAAPA